MCEYCGNTSGRTDVRGNCAGCGAPMRKKEGVSHMAKFYNPYFAGGAAQQQMQMQMQYAGGMSPAKTYLITWRIG